MLLRGARLGPEALITLALSVFFLAIGIYELCIGAGGLINGRENARGFLERGIVISMICVFALVLPLF